MTSWGNCKELFWIGNILVFIDTMTDYIWIYDYNNQNPNPPVPTIVTVTTK